MLWTQTECRRCILNLYMLLCVKRCQNQTRRTVSAGMCPPLCLRGGLGRTRVTWWSGRPCVGSSDRPSHDAERDRGEEYDGTEGGGEELESSQRPDSSEEDDERFIEDMKVGKQRRSQGGEVWENNLYIPTSRYFSDEETGKGGKSQEKTH